MSGRIARSLAVILLLAALALLVLVFADGGKTETKVPVGSDPRVLASEQRLERTLTARRLEVASYRRLTWGCEDRLGRSRARASWGIWALPKGLAPRTWVLKLWTRRYRGCKVELARRSLPLTNDWVTAVRIAQRPYPGTEARALAISRHEGGSGPWVWYSGMCSNPPCLWTGRHLGNDPFGDDAVGGPEQFRYSTFIVYWPSVLADLKRRGFIVPDLGWARPYVVAGASTGYGPWLSPLGQALTVTYMHYYGKQGHHWAGVPG